MLYCLRAGEKSIPPKYQTGILPTKSEGIRHGRVNCHLAALSPHEIQIRITLFPVSSPRNDPFPDRLDTGDRFSDATGTHHVAGGSFCRADGRAFEQLTKRIQLGFIP